MNLYLVDCGEMDVVEDRVYTDWCAPVIEITSPMRVFDLIVARTPGHARSIFLKDTEKRWSGTYLEWTDIKHVRQIRRGWAETAEIVTWDSELFEQPDVEAFLSDYFGWVEGEIA